MMVVTKTNLSAAVALGAVLSLALPVTAQAASYYYYGHRHRHHASFNHHHHSRFADRHRANRDAYSSYGGVVTGSSIGATPYYGAGYGAPAYAPGHYYGYGDGLLGGGGSLDGDLLGSQGILGVGVLGF